MEKKNLITLGIVGLALTLLIGASYFCYKKGYGAGFEDGKTVGKAAAQTQAQKAVTNPLEKIPETNPFEKVINPFKALYKNPFK